MIDFGQQPAPWRGIEKTLTAINLFEKAHGIDIPPEEAPSGDITPSSEASKECWGIGEVTVQCTSLARSQIEHALAEGKIPFAMTTVGLLLLILLLQTVDGGIVSFGLNDQNMPLINNLLPGVGGLPFLAWKVWKIAAMFPDRTENLLPAMPMVLPTPNATYGTLSPSVLYILDQFEDLRSHNGEVVYMVPPHRAKLAKARDDLHDPKAVDKLIKAQYGEGLILKDVQLDTSFKGKRIDRIILASATAKAKCPLCGQETTKRARGGPYNKPRQFWDTPIRFGVPTQVQIQRPRKYVCQNPACQKKQFAETFACVAPYKQFSIRLSGTVLAMAALTSYHGEQDLWTLCGVAISDDTIRRLVLGLVFEDDPDIRKIGIDDVAKRKGMTYYTIIYGLEDHRLLAIVDGRDGSELIKWLDKHKKVELICRDRGTAYSHAIDTWARGNGAQVTEIADRFHLIQNMIEQLKNHYLSSLPLRIGIIVENGTVRLIEGEEIPHKKAFAKIPKPSQEQLDNMKFDNTPPLDKAGNPIELNVVVSGVSKASETNRPEDARDSKPSDIPASTEKCDTGIAQDSIDDAEQEKRVSLFILISTIRRELDPSRPKKPQYKELAEKHGLTRKEVGQFCRKSPGEVDAILNGVSPEKRERAWAIVHPKAEQNNQGNQTSVPEAQASVKEDDDKPDEYTIICKIRSEFDRSKPRKPQYRALAEKYGVNDATVVGRYCRMTDEQVEAVKQKPVTQEGTPEKRPRKPKAKKIDDYKYIIYKMLVAGHNISDVFWYVKSKGCTLTDEGLLKHIIAIHGIAYPTSRLPLISQYIDLKYEEGVYVIRRCELLKYLVTVNPKTRKSELISKYEDRILEKYASVRNVQTMFREFHSTVMGDDEKAIDRFITKYQETELSSFCQSLTHDIEAIKNAIRYTYSSGFVEGNNSKFKMLKSVSRGRLQLNSLYQKCMLGFWYTLDDFDLKDVAPWLR